MSIFGGVGDFFGLDIGTSSVRVVQLRGGGKQRSLIKYGSIPIDAKTAQSDSGSHHQKLVESVQSLVHQAGISTKNVAVGIPSNRTFSTVVDIQKLAKNELEKTIQYQAENYIPSPLSEVKLGWSILGDSPSGSDKVEVLLATVANEFAEARLNALEAAGFNVIAMEPDSLALARALTPPQDPTAHIILDIGSQATDLVVMFGGEPRLVRSVPTGGQAFVKAAMQNLNVDEKQATQFVYKFGLSPDKLEGQVEKALAHTVDGLITDVEKSIKFFKTRYNNDIQKIVVTGGASVLPEFPSYIGRKLNMTIEIGNSWLNVSYPQAKYNDLIAVSNQFGVATGLALRDE